MTVPGTGRIDPGRLDLHSEASIADNDLDRLRRYLKINTIVLTGTVVALGVILIFLKSTHLAFAIVSLLIVLGALVLAWRLAVRNRPEGGTQVLALATWVVAITSASPFILPASVLWVLMPIVLPLVVLSRPVTRRLLIGTVISAVIVVIIGTTLPDPLRIQPSPPVTAGIVIGTVISITIVFAYSLALSFERSNEQRDLLRDSRKRLVTAAYDARRQIERDLLSNAAGRARTRAGADRSHPAHALPGDRRGAHRTTAG